VSSTQVLVVDDELQILRALRTILRGAGYEVTSATTGEDALTAAAATLPDAVILDLVLPDGHGSDVCRELRRWSDVPIVAFSAGGDEQEKVAALDAGANDYVTKPFAVDDLIGRLRAVLRRTRPTGERVIEVGELVLDLEERALTVAGQAVSLTPHEFELLLYFAQNEGKLLTHPMILHEIWGPRYGTESQYLHLCVSQLRSKIERDPARPRYLLTEAGAGYRLVNPVATQA
jgi:two-component system, OmpR family, KDP operon response regulator KdpE